MLLRSLTLLALTACAVEDVSSTDQSLSIAFPEPRVATDAPTLAVMLQTAGPILIPANVSIDMTGWREIPITAGVELYSTRGSDPATSEGGMIYTTDLSRNYTLFDVIGPNVRIHDLRLRGPSLGGPSSLAGVSGIGINRNLATNVQIDHCDISDWTMAGVVVGGPGRAADALEASDLRVEANYIHDNVRDGAGYGVLDGGGAYVWIEGNVFDDNRHSVSADGEPEEGYVALHNYILDGGRMEHTSVLGVPDYYYWNQHFDVHGSGDGHYGGGAGEYFLITNNTIRGAETNFYGITRRALWLRGTPSVGMQFTNNTLLHPDVDAAVEIDGSVPATAYDDTPNTYATDTSSDFLVGDFDGDGRDDVLETTGTAWFLSSAGISDWRYLQADAHRASQLVVGDFNGDRRADLLLVENGHWYVSYGATGAWTVLATMPEPLAQLRFGDFDGDGQADAFKTDGATWWISYGARSPWTPLSQGQNLALANLAFADLDGDGKTDVIRTNETTWYVKRGGVGGWTVLRSGIATSPGSLVFANFDGVRGADIAVLRGTQWGYYPDGSGAWTALRTPSTAELAVPITPLVGKFSPDSIADALQWTLDYNAGTGTYHAGAYFMLAANGRGSYGQWSRYHMR